MNGAGPQVSTVSSVAGYSEETADGQTTVQYQGLGTSSPLRD